VSSMAVQAIYEYLEEDMTERSSPLVTMTQSNDSPSSLTLNDSSVDLNNETCSSTETVHIFIHSSFVTAVSIATTF